MKCVVYLTDARKGVTFRDGFSDGYLTLEGGVTSHFDSCAVRSFDSVDDAKVYLALQGIDCAPGVFPGKLTGYVAHDCREYLR